MNGRSSSACRATRRGLFRATNNNALRPILSGRLCKKRPEKLVSASSLRAQPFHELPVFSIFRFPPPRPGRPLRETLFELEKILVILFVRADQVFTVRVKLQKRHGEGDARGESKIAARPNTSGGRMMAPVRRPSQTGKKRNRRSKRTSCGPSPAPKIRVGRFIHTASTKTGRCRSTAPR